MVTESLYSTTARQQIPGPGTTVRCSSGSGGGSCYKNPPPCPSKASHEKQHDLDPAAGYHPHKTQQQAGRQVKFKQYCSVPVLVGIRVVDAERLYEYGMRLSRVSPTTTPTPHLHRQRPAPPRLRVPRLGLQHLRHRGSHSSLPPPTYHHASFPASL